jgi:hypothetical protein
LLRRFTGSNCKEDTVRVKPRKNTARSKKTPTTRAGRLVRRQDGAPLSRDVRVGAAALGILGVGVLVMMVASRPNADIHEAGSAQNPAASPSSALIAAATAPVASDAAAPAPKDTGTVTAPVTITGCLERADTTFRLKDAEGDDVPRSRSWKSGFLKKSPASIQVVDAANRLKLPAHVGQRITVTGTLIDRELRVRSLQTVTASCGGSKTKV